MAKQTIKTAFFGKGGKLQEEINSFIFSSDDRLISARENPERKDRTLTKDAQKAGKAVMEFVGAGNEYIYLKGKQLNKNPFTGKNIAKSPLSKLLKGENVSSLENIGYTQQNLKTSLKSMKVFYSSGFITETDIKNSMLNRAGVKTGETYETLAKIGNNRIIAAKCHIFNNNKFKIEEVKKVTGFDISAPDLSENFNKKYIDNNKNLNQSYKNQINETIKLLFESSIEMECKSIIIPAIGSGAFGTAEFKEGKKSYSKEICEIVASSIKEQIDNYKDKGVESIVCSVMGDAYTAYKDEFDNYTGKVEIMITEAEMTNVAIKLNEIYHDYEVGYVIAGHPTRPIGNGWLVNQDGTGAQAQEESCTKHLVDFIAVFDGLWNKLNIFDIENNSVKITRETELKGVLAHYIETMEVVQETQEMNEEKFLAGVIGNTKEEQIMANTYNEDDFKCGFVWDL